MISCGPGLRDASKLSADASLADLGLDSLMGVEVKQTLEREFGLALEPTAVRQLTFKRLAEIESGTDAGKAAPPSADHQAETTGREQTQRPAAETPAESAHSQNELFGEFQLAFWRVLMRAVFGIF